MQEGCYFSVWLMPTEEALDVPFIRSIVTQAATDPRLQLHCLLCEGKCGFIYGTTRYVVIGYNEDPSETNFMTCVCAKCSRGRSVDDLRPQVFNRIRATIMPDAKLVGLHPGGHA